ncbi:hypothetical protein Rs2_32427 [Raphanus sativus]|nr:hypothetical protein Rs2_32427 [Raphanus sativus]
MGNICCCGGRKMSNVPPATEITPVQPHPPQNPTPYGSACAVVFEPFCAETMAAPNREGGRFSQIVTNWYVTLWSDLDSPAGYVYFLSHYGRIWTHQVRYSGYYRVYGMEEKPCSSPPPASKHSGGYTTVSNSRV